MRKFIILFSILSFSCSAQDREDTNIMAGAIDVLHYDIQIRVVDSDASMYGTTDIQFRTLIDLSEVKFNLKGLTLTESRLDGEMILSQYQGGIISVTPRNRFKKDTIHKISFAYSGKPKDGLIVKTNKYKIFSAFSDNWPNRARYWFPCIDHPSDKATVSFSVTVPAKYKAVANGMPVPEDLNSMTPTGNSDPAGKMKTFRFEMNVPTPTYCMVIGVCTFSVCSTQTENKIPIYYYTFPEDSLNAVNAFARVPDMIKFFESTIGPYPFPKLALVQSSTIYGAMENSSAIFFPEGGAPYNGKGKNEATVAHEIAHQWFGDDLTESNWPELWLSEGFATYFSALYFESRDGKERLDEFINRTRTSYLKRGGKKPVITDDYAKLIDLLNAENYSKGALFLHRLRQEMGDEKFFSGIRVYYQRFKHGNVTTEDFKHIMNEISGKDLTPLFQKWLYQPGLPED